MVDDRTFVTPSPMVVRMKPDPARPDVRPFYVPQPRVEIWYRTKLGSCYLANGWETIGETKVENNRELDPRDPANVSLFPAKTDPSRRIDTFDVIRYAVGEGTNQVLSVVVPAGKIYVPKVTISTLNPSQNNYDLRYFGDDITPAIPRHFDSDPPGYSPITWLWDVTVPQDPPYASGSFKGLGDVDPLADQGARLRQQQQPGLDPQLPGRGCGHTLQGQPGLRRLRPAAATCCPISIWRPPSLPPGKNVADVIIEREGGPRCDCPPSATASTARPASPAARATCRPRTAPGGAKTNWDLLQAMKIGTPGPNLAVHAPAATALKALNDGRADPAGHHRQPRVHARAEDGGHGRDRPPRRRRQHGQGPRGFLRRQGLHHRPVGAGVRLPAAGRHGQRLRRLLLHPLRRRGQRGHHPRHRPHQEHPHARGAPTPAW